MALVVTRLSESLDSIEYQDRSRTDLGHPEHNQVLVRMLRAPVNPSDFNWVHGTYHQAFARANFNYGRALDALSMDPEMTQPIKYPPYVLGVEGVGIVEECGSGLLARRLRGKRVAVAADQHGTWQKYAIFDAKKALPVPDSIDDAQAAMLFVNPLTAYAMVREVLQVQPGKWLLVSAAGSALGQMVIKLSARMGYNVVAIVRRDQAVEPLQKLGAAAVVSTESQNLQEQVHQITGGKGADYAMDCVGGPLATDLMQCMTRGGRMLLYGTLAGTPAQLNPRDLMMPNVQINGFFLPNWLGSVSLFKKLRVIKKVFGLVADGTFASEIGHTFSLENYADALETARSVGRGGKVQFVMDNGH